MSGQITDKVENWERLGKTWEYSLVPSLCSRNKQNPGNPGNLGIQKLFKSRYHTFQV